MTAVQNQPITRKYYCVRGSHELDALWGVYRRGDFSVQLTPTENWLLYFLMTSDKPVSRDTIWNEAWHRGPSLRLTNQVEVYINYLRRKIEPEPRRPRYIVTVRGGGYQFNA